MGDVLIMASAQRKIKVRIRSSKKVEEHRGESLCDGSPAERRICRDRDEESRQRSADKRRRKREIWAGKEPLDQLAVGIVEEEKKKQCGVGNPRHDKLGRFATKDDNTSWGLGGYKSGKTDCTSGKSQMTPGSNQRKITKHPCGSVSTGSKGGIGKHKYRCKDKTALWEIDENDEWIKIKKSAFERLIGIDPDNIPGNDLNLFEEYIQEQKKLNPKIKTLCNNYGFLTFKDFLIRQDYLERSQSGKLFDKKKG